MKYFKKNFINEKISGLSIEGLKNWILNRLRGSDPLFPINEDENQKKFELIAVSYGEIGEIHFRDNFHELMDDLLDNLIYISLDKKRLALDKDFCCEIISLFERIPDFKNKNELYDLAVKGRFRGIKAFDREEMDLHRVILNTLACHRSVGDYDIWINQILHNRENKWYVGISFYALLNRRYRLDIILDSKPLGIFIDRFKDDLEEFTSCIEAILNGYGEEKILNQLKNIHKKLTLDQNATLENVLEKFGLKK